MKVQIQPESPTKTEIGSTVAPVMPQPQVDKKSRDEVLSEIAKDCVASPQDYLRDSVACTGE